MSHYTVLVIGDDVEGKLAPYDENVEVAPYKNYLDSEAIERMAKHYKVDTHDLQELADKMEDWASYEGGVDTQGLFKLSTYNPQAKWDWYSIGGRWLGMFKLKDGKQGITGRAGVFDNKPTHDGGVDQAKFGDIDWEATTKLPDKTLEYYNDLWDWIEGKLTDLEARAKEIFILYKKEYYLDRYGTREAYIRRESAFTTYAVVTEDGQWCAPGDMGWWGMSSETDDAQEKWDNNYWDMFLKGLAPDTLLTIVDCHI